MHARALAVSPFGYYLPSSLFRLYLHSLHASRTPNPLCGGPSQLILGSATRRAGREGAPRNTRGSLRAAVWVFLSHSPAWGLTPTTLIQESAQ